MRVERPAFFEFFAGGGMARIGLGSRWRCMFANEWRPEKAASYRRYFGGRELHVEDVAKLTLDDLPGVPTLVWASFPCQDLSLAGMGAGLDGPRSGAFWPFWRLIAQAIAAGRVPPVVVLENVVGTLSSHGGRDFTAIVETLSGSGYRVGALVMDAVRFLPQSRPRLFVVAAHSRHTISPGLCDSGEGEAWRPRSLREAYARLPERLRGAWMWWALPLPSADVPDLAALIERQPEGVAWHTAAGTERLLGLMAPPHREKVEEAQRARRRIVGTIYRRTRPNGRGGSAQRAEVRFDGISGCLRTPAGGSSRQAVIVVEGNRVRTRLLSPREAARLMGVPEDYPLPANYNEAYRLSGDGLAVPVVAWLEKHLLRPLANCGAAA